MTGLPKPPKRIVRLFAGILLLGCVGETLLTIATPHMCAASPLDDQAIERRESLRAQAQTATIAGRVVYEADPKRRWRYSRYYINDSTTGALAEAVVGLRGKTLKKYPSPEKSKMWQMDQKDVRFTPETLAIRAGDSVKFTNSDRQVHNISTNSPFVRLDRTIRGDQEAVQEFPRAGGVRQPIVLGCKLHSAMRAWIFVFDHPFFHLTQADGKFRFENVPPGEYQLEMAHPAGGLQRTIKINVKPGEQLQLDIRVSPDHKLES